MNARWLVPVALLVAFLAAPSSAQAAPLVSSLRARVFSSAPSTEAGAVTAAPFQLAPQKTEALPLDDGGGVGSDTRRILSLVLGIIPGFGIGHLIAHDQGGFVLFLIIDIAIAVVSGVLIIGLHGGSLLYGLGGVLVLVERIVEGLDAYASAGGERFLSIARENTLVVPGPAVPTTKMFQLAF